MIMNSKFFMKGLRALAFMLAAFAMMAGPSFAADVTVDLAAVAAEWLPPGGTVGVDEITMWAFIADTGVCPSPPVAWDTGPEFPLPAGSLTAGDNLTINLRNCLSDEVSIVIPGQVSTGAPVVVGGRVRSFTHETAPGTTGVYTWTGLREGTYLYQSGTHPAKQVQMGLYGALSVLPATPGQAYNDPNTAFDNEVVLLYSEIDPVLHDPPTTAKSLNYKPEYFLINGQPYPDAVPILADPINANERVLIRFLNAGLKTHVPTLLGGYMSVIAEDGNLYPYQKEQYSVSLPAGKTIDALWVPATDGTYPVYDARHYLTSAGAPEGGMLVKLEVGPDGNAPVAVDDNYTVAEDGTLTATVGGTPAGVLDNDSPGAGPGPLTAVLVNGPAGTLILNTDGSFTYEPDQDFFGTDGFTYKANDGTLDSNVANVTIMVNGTNDAPVANLDSYDAVEGETLTVAAPGVLGNDTDVDGDQLTAVLNTDVTGGTLTLNSDGSFDYTPDAGTTGDSFIYFANDGTVNSSLAATVTITVVSAANQPPVAANDTATTKKNAAVDINVIANDYDPDGFIFPGSVVVISSPANGTVVNNANGTVTYTPVDNYRGPDSFTYVVYDNEGASSNKATVTVDVTNK
jgi:VCBS repeat-containing protein